MWNCDFPFVKDLVKHCLSKALKQSLIIKFQFIYSQTWELDVKIYKKKKKELDIKVQFI